MARELSDWLSAYLKYAEYEEPPKAYHTWVGISMIAAALQRRCYMKRGHRKIYPNMYIVLIGPSGKCRKGTAMSLGREIVDGAKMAVTSESITREALIRAMKDSVDNFNDPTTGKITFHCSLYCMSEELAVFLGQEDTRFLADLTDWYDARDIWKYDTKTAGKDHIQGVCFNLLGSTAAEWLQSILPGEALGGGFTSRIIFIVEEKKGLINPDPTTDPELQTKLIKDLEMISTISGEMVFDAVAKAAYERWYIKQEKLVEAGQPPISDPRFSGYCERRATHARKLAMVLSASRGNSRTVLVTDFERALSILQAAEPNMNRAFGGLGKAKYSEVTEKVLEVLMARGQVSRTELMRMFYRDMDSVALEVVERVLMHMKVVQIRDIPEMGERIYKYII